MACRAFDIDVRQELHVERNRSRAVARRATQLASVIGECPPLSDRWSAQHLIFANARRRSSWTPQYVATVERMFAPIGVASIRCALDTPSASRSRTCVGCGDLSIRDCKAGINISSTIVVLPEPDTPVTAVSRPRGISTDNGPTVCRRSVSI